MLQLVFCILHLYIYLADRDILTIILLLQHLYTGIQLLLLLINNYHFLETFNIHTLSLFCKKTASIKNKNIIIYIFYAGRLYQSLKVIQVPKYRKLIIVSNLYIVFLV